MSSSSEKLIIHVSNELLKPSAFKVYDGLFSVDKINSQFDSFDFKKPIEYNVTLTNTGDGILVSGTATGKAITSCSRCLEDVTVDIKANIDVYYLLEPPQEQEDIEINEFEVLPQSKDIPLGEIIKATIAVDAPMKPLCKHNCKGLCPKCGKNLNKEACDCSSQIDSSSPFSVLKNFKIK